MAARSDARWGVTRSGYRYERIKAAELLPREGDEPFSYSCGEKNCGAFIQGGPAALKEHRHTVHPEIYGEGWPKL
jgi:hypothetical protein